MLKRHFSLMEITIFAVNSILGLGVFYLMLDVQNNYRIGSYILFSLLIVYLLDLSIGYVYGFLGSAYGRSAGEYAFISRMIHPLVGFLLGWAVVFNLIARISFYLRVLSLILKDAFASHLPEHITHFEIGLILVFIMLLLMMSGARFIIRLQTAVFFITLLFFLVSSIYMANHFSLDVFKGNFSSASWKEIFIVATVLFSMYQGFESVTYVGGEVKNHRKNIPLAIFFSLTIVFLIYFFFALLIYGTFDLNAIAEAGSVFKLLPSELSQFLMYALALMLFVKISLGMYSASRFFYAWGKDKVLSSIFSLLDKSKSVPWFSITFIGLMLSFLYLLNLPLISLATLAAFTTSITYFLMSIAALSLKYRRKHLYSLSSLKFKYDVVIILFVSAVSLLIMYSAAFIDLKTLSLSLIWMSIGIIIYFFRKEKHNLIEEIEKEMECLKAKMHHSHMPANLHEQ
ncbi:MAG: APC family permease [Candidatus Nanohaloarchaeota archaeon]|nr:APC family permease [Candidatus Nanohaloarchaeota archaeon]